MTTAMATAVVEMQTTTVIDTAADGQGTILLGGAPDSEELPGWRQKVRELRRRSHWTPRPQPQPQPPARRGLRSPAIARPRPSGSTVRTRDVDSGVPSLVSAPATISATASHESHRSAQAAAAATRLAPATAPASATTPAPSPALVPAAPVPAPPQAPTQAPGTGAGLLDVEVRLTTREKLQTQVLASALGLRADRMADFTEQENEKLRQFQTAYDANRTDWFRGKRMPSIIFELVALGSDGAGSVLGGGTQTSICVRGLRSGDDIKRFHEVMSQSAIRRLYSGLWLSYDRTLIKRPAREVEGEYDHLPSSLGETLCGARLVTRRAGHRERSSTIGGIIEVGGKLYAMTSSHAPEDEEEEAAPGTAFLVDGSSPSTLVEANYDDDFEPALILDLPLPTNPVRGEDAAETPSHFWPTLSVTGSAREHQDGDWRLIPLAASHCFPNSVPRPSEHSSAVKPTYISEPLDTNPSRRHVSILAGFSGLCQGTLLSSPAFLSIRGAAPTAVWTIVLNNDKALQKGDSGSWAVDDQGRWLGTVTAMSGGDAYIIPAHDHLERMRSLFSDPVGLPSPVRCYIELAGDQFLPDDVSNSFAAKALTRDVLIASSWDTDQRMRRVALALAKATTMFVRFPRYERGLKVLLRTFGNGLADKLMHGLTESEMSEIADPMTDEAMAFHRLKEAYDLMVAEGWSGTRADFQAILSSSVPADDDGISFRLIPPGVSRHAGTEPSLIPVETTKEKPGYHGITSISTDPHILILEPSPAGNRWYLSRRLFILDDLCDLPRCCYVFLDWINYPPADGRREKLLAHFNVPELLANRTCSELSGYFGSKATYGGKGTPKHLISSTTWFRCLLKMVQKVDDDPHDDGPEYVTRRGYRWFEMSFFTRWDSSGTSQVLCIDTPPDFPAQLQRLLDKRAQPVNLRDPFAMHVNLVDQIIVHANISVWRVRDPVRLLEKSRMQIGAIFSASHEMSRHAIHVAETLEATIDTVREMQQRQTEIHGILCNYLDETYKDHARGYAQFQISLLKNLKLRSDSNQERLKNEIELAFNNLACQDNSIMKSISFLCRVFLPPIFISAFFSTTFFNFGDEGSLQVSDKLWIYWVTAIPTTMVSVTLYWMWFAHSDSIGRFKEWSRWAGQLWGKTKASRQGSEKPKHESA